LEDESETENIEIDKKKKRGRPIDPNSKSQQKKRAQQVKKEIKNTQYVQTDSFIDFKNSVE
jgi:hypothetical protein